MYSFLIPVNLRNHRRARLNGYILYTSKGLKIKSMQTCLNNLKQSLGNNGIPTLATPQPRRSRVEYLSIDCSTRLCNRFTPLLLTICEYQNIQVNSTNV